LQAVLVRKLNGNNMALGSVSVKLDNVTELNTHATKHRIISLTKSVVLIYVLTFVFP